MRKFLLSVVLTLAAAVAVVRLTGTSPFPERTEVAPVRADYPIGISFGERLSRVPRKTVDRALDDASAMGANWIRIDLSWASLQPESADRYEWSRVDRIMRRAHDRDLSVLGVLTYTPAWARRDGCRTFNCPPARDADFARFARAVAQRYAGTLRGYEIWNEPNLDQFWADPDPLAYRRLLVRTVRAIDRADPDATVLFGGLAASDPDPRVVTAARFLRFVCEDRTSCQGVDAVSFHPYTYPRSPLDTAEPPTSWQHITERNANEPSLRTAMDEVGLSRQTVWVTEFGAPTGDGSTPETPTVRPHAFVSERLQASIYRDAVQAAVGDPSVVGGLFYHTWSDMGQHGTYEDDFGLVRQDGSRKPAFGAVEAAVRDLLPGRAAPSCRGRTCPATTPFRRRRGQAHAGPAASRTAASVWAR